MSKLLSTLKTEDPHEFGYKSARSQQTQEYFLSRCEDMDLIDRECAIEGWNEYWEEQCGGASARMIGDTT